MESPSFHNLDLVELRKPFDEGIGGPLGLSGCSLQRPKIVSRSYIMGNQVEKSSHLSMNQISIIIVNLKFSSKRLSRVTNRQKICIFYLPSTAILTDFAKTNSGEVAYLLANITISLPVLKKIAIFEVPRKFVFWRFSLSLY